MTPLQYIKQQLELHNGFNLHITACEKYPEFAEWFRCDKNNWENCRAFLAMVDSYIGE